MFVWISFMCLRVHVDFIQPLATRNNKRCYLLFKTKRFRLGRKAEIWVLTWITSPKFRTASKRKYWSQSESRYVQHSSLRLEPLSRVQPRSRQSGLGLAMSTSRRFAVVRHHWFQPFVSCLLLTCRTAFPAQQLRPSGVLSCWPDGLELTPGFYSGSNEQHRLF